CILGRIGSMFSFEHNQIPPPPSSRRTPPTEASYYQDLFADLTLRIEWLEQVIGGVPERDASHEALAQLRGWSKALHDLHHAVGNVQAHLFDKRFAALFAPQAPLAAFLARLYAWTEEISGVFETLAVKLRRQEPVSLIFSQRSVNASYAEFH